MSDAQDRGWGPGWPNCQRDQIVLLDVDGVLFREHRIVDLKPVQEADFPGGIRREIAELVERLCLETIRRGYRLVDGWCWGFACRPIKGTTSTPSNHSWGLAVDINAPRNPYGSRLITDMPAWMPKLWATYGFRWGGSYSGNKDAMHYEFMGTPADAHRHTDRARAADLGEEEDLALLSHAEQRELRENLAFFRHLRDGLRPGEEKATAKGAGRRVARATRIVEVQSQTATDETP
ncbi:MAG TPA: M15 family metallopeptidase [Actinomycetota bacterium]|nr:M15 family metallopeptidase [Actinomycetota bacterium]